MSCKSWPLSVCPNIACAERNGLQSNRSLLQYLDDHQIAVSGGSSSTSHVLKALGIESSFDNIRFSFSKFNTAEEVDHVAGVIASVYQTVAA